MAPDSPGFLPKVAVASLPARQLACTHCRCSFAFSGRKTNMALVLQVTEAAPSLSISFGPTCTMRQHSRLLPQTSPINTPVYKSLQCSKHIPPSLGTLLTLTLLTLWNLNIVPSKAICSCPLKHLCLGWIQLKAQNS